MSRFKNEITHLQAHIKTLRLGAGGIQEIFEIPLAADEAAAMKAAGDAVKELVAATPKG